MSTFADIRTQRVKVSLTYRMRYNIMSFSWMTASPLSTTLKLNFFSLDPNNNLAKYYTTLSTFTRNLGFIFNEIAL